MITFPRSVWWLFLCAFLVSLAVASPAAAQDAPIRTHLDLIGPPDLSSPQATLITLRTSVEQAYDVLERAYDEYRADPGFFPTPEVSEKVQRVDLLLRRAMATLDLSLIPLVNREQAGVETVLLLKEILDRLPTINAEAVPDAQTVKADNLKAWALPYTDLEIVKAETGLKAGQFVFSAESIARARELYDTVRAYAERPDSRSDLYRFYTLTPGDLLPPKWYLWIEELPFWAQDSFFLGEALWQWVGLLVTLVILFGLWWAVAKALRRRVTTVAPGRGFVLRVIPPILLIGVSLLAKWIIVRQINVSGPVLWATSTVLQGIAYLAAAWVAYLFCVGIGERMAASSQVGRASIDASLIRVAARVVGIAAVVTTAFIGATNIGLPIYGVIAGLGVGGLALGLAARPTLENLIGGFILYADRPVRVGDTCKFGDKNGTIEEIGLRSTRVRAHDRTLITVPNAEFSNMEIINVSRRDQTLLDTTVGLRYETTDDQMQTILERIRALLEANPEVIRDTIRVRFQELGAYSLGIGIRAFIKAPSTTGFLEVQEGILFGVRKIIAEARAEIAFPSQTNYISERPGVAVPPAGPAPADGAATSRRGRTRSRRERRER